MTWKASVAVLAASLVSLVPGGAYADHKGKVPEAVLREGGERIQRGERIAECWWSKDHKTYCAQRIEGHHFPAADRVAEGARLRIRVRYPNEPKKFLLKKWHEIKDSGQPKGEGDRKYVRLREVRRNGNVVAWDAIFAVRRPDKHYYLNALVLWKGGGTGAYDFHVRTDE